VRWTIVRASLRVKAIHGCKVGVIGFFYLGQTTGDVPGTAYCVIPQVSSVVSVKKDRGGGALFAWRPTLLKTKRWATYLLCRTGE